MDLKISDNDFLEIAGRLKDAELVVCPLFPFPKCFLGTGKLIGRRSFEFIKIGPQPFLVFIFFVAFIINLYKFDLIFTI